VLTVPLMTHSKLRLNCNSYRLRSSCWWY